MYTFFNKKTFLAEPQFSEHNARYQAEKFLIFYLTFISLFSLIVYSVRFNPSYKRFHLLIFPCLLKRMVLPRSSRSEVLCRKGFLRNFSKVTGKHLCQSLFFNKETLTQALSCEFSEISKSTFSYRTPSVAASDYH